MKKSKINLAIVGVGKIVRDQHLPAIEKSSRYTLMATASRNQSLPGVEAFTDIQTMLLNRPSIDAVALCMPPQFRFSAACVALKAGVDVLLEKPPGATVCEVEYLADLAKRNDCRLYTTWHSRHGAAVARAKELLSQNDIEIQSVEIQWKEDVRKWHPGQDWIWQAGGLGVFDPGINGLSILTEILPDNMLVRSAELLFPSNKEAPIAANIDFRTASGVGIEAQFDWRTTGQEQWDINVTTNKGVLKIGSGGAILSMDGQATDTAEHSPYGEYEAIYEKFAEVIDTKIDAVDLTPLKLVADAFLLGRRVVVDAFSD